MKSIEDRISTRPTRQTNDIDFENTQSRVRNISIDSKPIIWAFDAFLDHYDVHIRTAQILEKLFPLSPILPVYILSEESFSDRGLSGSLRPALKPMAQKTMNQLLKDISLHHAHQPQTTLRQKSHLKKPRVLVEASASRLACAKRLLRFAERIHASRIVFASNGNRGLSRLFNGSFSENIIDNSRLPMLVCGPKLARLDQRPDVIVFPTDFSIACQSAFDSVLELAHHYNAEVHLFHRTIHVLDSVIQTGVHMLGGGWVSVEAYMNQPAEDHEQEIADALKKARTFGVRASYIQENFREPTSHAIVQYADTLKSNSVLLAMVSQTGAMASALLGSVTRDVIRMSPWPVYLVPKADEKE